MISYNIIIIHLPWEGFTSFGHLQVGQWPCLGVYYIRVKVTTFDFHLCVTCDMIIWFPFVCHMQYACSLIGNSKRINGILKLVFIQEEQCSTFHVMCSLGTGNSFSRNDNNSVGKVLNSLCGITIVPSGMLSPLLRNDNNSPMRAITSPLGMTIVFWGGLSPLSKEW